MAVVAVVAVVVGLVVIFFIASLHSRFGHNRSQIAIIAPGFRVTLQSMVTVKQEPPSLPDSRQEPPSLPDSRPSCTAPPCKADFQHTLEKAGGPMQLLAERYPDEKSQQEFGEKLNIYFKHDGINYSVNLISAALQPGIIWNRRCSSTGCRTWACARRPRRGAHPGCPRA